MLIRLRSCEAVECGYITMVIQIYKDKTRARRRRKIHSQCFTSNAASFLISGLTR